MRRKREARPHEAGWGVAAMRYVSLKISGQRLPACKADSNLSTAQRPMVATSIAMIALGHLCGEVIRLSEQRCAGLARLGVRPRSLYYGPLGLAWKTEEAVPGHFDLVTSTHDPQRLSVGL